VKSTGSSLQWRLLLIVALIFSSLTLRSAPVLAALSGLVTSAASPSNAAPSIGQQITVTINIDMSGANSPDNYLGSFTGTLDWSTSVLSYSSNSGIQGGFTGNVNSSGAGSGHLVFNGANASGATGNIIVLTITFNVVGAGTSVLHLAYSAMAAATTFANLLPILTVTDGQFVVAALPGDLDSDCDVDIVDIMLVASRWNMALGDPLYDPRYDLDGDGDIDIVDIMLVAIHWGTRCQSA
jgi:hypothetical protein